MSQIQGSLVFFMNNLSSEGASQNTIDSYLFDLQNFLKRFSPTKRLNSYTEKDIQKYIRFLTSTTKGETKEKYKNTTINRHIRSIRKFFSFMVRNRSISRNPCEYTQQLPEPKTLPKVLTRDEIHDLLKKIPQDKNQNKTILKFIYQTGIRVSEALKLRISDIDFQNSKIKIHGKGKKERVIPVEEKFLAPLKVLTGSTEAKNGNNLIFHRPDGKPILRNTLNRHLKKYAKLAKVNATIHTLRHSFATHMLEGGFPLVHIQEYLGHGNINTTRIYLHIADPEMLRQYKKFSKTLA